jgi:glycosyltransferase involved in cell wall biosynthesis
MKIRLFPKLRRRRPPAVDVQAEPKHPSAPPIFDAAYYLQVNPDLREKKIDPWVHYCQQGFREKRNPHPLFDLKYYCQRYLRNGSNQDPLQHYLQNDDPLRKTHPLFDAPFYASQIGLKVLDKTLLEHFVTTAIEFHKSPSPFFDSAAYLKTHADIARAKMCPLYHYARFGRSEGRDIFIDANHIKSIQSQDPTEIQSVCNYLGNNVEFAHRILGLDKNVPTVVCVSHDASMTGAPLIILKIAERLNCNYGMNVVNLLCNSGTLFDRFANVGPTYSLGGSAPHKNETAFKIKMGVFLGLLQLLNPIGVYVNSAESRHTIGELATLGAPIHTLLHENARCYYQFLESPFADIAKFSERIIFPSAYVQNAATHFGEISESQCEIIPQGLLKEELLEPPNREVSTNLRNEFGIPDDATLILGCGTGDGRKGLDIFVSTAISLLNQSPDSKIYFGWLGANEIRCNTSHNFWANWDVEASGYADRILFFGPHQNVADFFYASDILFLTSRMDPYPCVVNEAMACGKPVVLFKDGSGCVDLVTEQGGAIVPYGDICAACETLKNLAMDKKARQLAGARNRSHVKNNMDFDDYVASLFDRLSTDIQKPDYAEKNRGEIRTLIGKRQISKKRVYLLASTWDDSAANCFAETLCSQLNSKDFDATILFTGRKASGLRQEQLPGVPYRFVDTKGDPASKNCESLANFLRSAQPAVVIPNCSEASSSLALKQSPRIRFVGVLHADEPEYYLYGYRMGHFWDAIVSASETIQSKLLHLNPSFGKKAHVIGHGVQQMPALQTGINENRSFERLKILYPGPSAKSKNQLGDILQLTRHLDEHKIPFEITIPGELPDGKSYSEALNILIRNGKLSLTGKLTSRQLQIELANHHVVYLTGHNPVNSRFVLQAMACCCIPATTNLKSEISEYLIHDKNALIAASKSTERLALELVRLFKSASLRRRLSRNASLTIQENKLTADHMGEQFADVIDQVFKNISQGKSASRTLPFPDVTRLLDAA